MGNLPSYEELERRVQQLETELSVNQDILLLKNLFNGIPEPMAMIDIQGKIIFANSATAQILGTTLENLSGMDYYQTVSQEQAESRRIINNRVIKNGKTFIYEDAFNERHFVKRVSPIFSADNRVSHLMILALDITHSKKIENALKVTEEKYKTVFDNSADGIIVIDDTGVITEWNKRIEENTGFSKEEAIGEKIWDLQHSLLTEEWKKIYFPDSLQKIWMNFIVTLTANQLVSKEGQYIGKGGRVILTEDIIEAVIINEKKYLCVIQRDLTERINAEQKVKESELKLKKLNETKDKLFSVIAHDLKSPFNVILGYSRLIGEIIRKSDIEKSEEYLDIIASSAQNTIILLDNLLTWARSQTGQIVFNPEKLVLKHVIESVLELIDSSAKFKEIEIHNNVSDNIITLSDFNLLKIILQNLISNAIKFTNHGGEINLDAKPDQNFVELVVSDNGTGIVDKRIKSLFTIESNMPTVGTADEKGSGLGLVICREFVEKQGGKIWVESKPGKGSRFIFTIPVFGEINETDTIENSVSSSPESNHLRNLKILIADDEHYARNLLKMLVENFSREVLFAKTGIEAVESFQNNPDIDLIFMDNGMAELDGAGATALIRQFNKEVVIIAISANELKEDKDMLLKAGCTDFMTKPIQRDLLNDLIMKYFQ
jgi:PAS domain S-box-containing protein